jgi:uncharacterized membrane protein YdjX (TVP38/TMEM64 family)
MTPPSTKIKPLSEPLKWALAIGIVAASIAIYWFFVRDNVLTPESIRAHIEAWGVWGPLAVVALILVAVVITPIPSAPIALTSGALYGHTWGALYVAIGAELGAVIAFVIARWVGAATVKRWLGERLDVGLLGSQNTLMFLVFASRLLPFVSFDIVSYAAGLTVLHVWRFALATFAGIVPASFLLAHFGREMGSGNAERIGWAALLLGALVALPLAVKWLAARYRRRSK